MAEQKDESYFVEVQGRLKWFMDRLILSKQRFKNIALQGLEDHGPGAVMVKVEHEDLMAKNGDNLKVAYVPIAVLDQMGNPKAVVDAKAANAVHGEFCLVVMSRTDSLALLDSCVVSV